MRHSWFVTYISALDAVCSEICIDRLPCVRQCRREGQNYAESVAPMSSAKTAAAAGDSR
jgi:hypothetical protein